MAYQEDIFDRLKAVHERDQAKYIKPWMVSWEYQDKRNKRQVKYSEELPEDFYAFDGPADLYNWWHWQTTAIKPDYFPKDQMAELTELSHKFDARHNETHNIGFDMENQYDDYIGRNNAQDYVLANFYPMQEDDGPYRVLDFGAGYGRQVNLWSQKRDNLVFCAMDAIPKSYCLQHVYYNSAELPLHDYAVDPDNFKVDGDVPGIYHLTTWRCDLIPDNFFDQIMVVQVLQELNGQLASYMIEQFHRMLKPTGRLYIRDHDQAWRPTHRLNLNKVLEDAGFVLEFRPHIVDRKDLHGIPRFWRKQNPEIEQQESVGFNQRMQELMQDVDSATGGKLKNVVKKVLGK